MGLVQRATQRQDGIDALSYSKERRLGRPLFGRHICERKRSEHTFARKRVHTSALTGNLDEHGHKRGVSDSLENSGSPLCYGVGSANFAAFPGAERRDKTYAQL